MRVCNLVWITAMVCGLAAWGCAGSVEKALSQSQTLMAVNAAKGQVKKVAMVQTPLPESVFDQNAGNLFFNTLSATLQKESTDLLLLTSETGGLPDFMAALQRSKSPIDAETLNIEGRRSSFNGLITTALHNVQVMAYRSGVFWFRKTKYRFQFEVTLDLYDPFTGAKLLSILKDGSAKISDAVYDDFKVGAVTNSVDLDEAVVDMAEDVGELVAKTLAAQPWMVSVTKVDDGRIFLSAGGQAGLRTGQRLAVVEGQRVLNGPQGQKFIVPGLIVDEITITQVSELSAEAVADTVGKIKSGDMAIPIK